MPTKISKTYVPSAKEKYMCAKRKAFFRKALAEWKNELIEQNNMDIEVQAQEANRDLAEGILRDIVNKYKKAGKKVWLSKNPERELEYKQKQSAVRKEANEDILEGFNQLN